MSDAIRYLPETERPVVGRNILVLGYDPLQESPIVDSGFGPTTLARLQRQAWDNDREVPETVVKEIERAVEHLRKGGPPR